MEVVHPLGTSLLGVLRPCHLLVGTVFQQRRLQYLLTEIAVLFTWRQVIFDGCMGILKSKEPANTRTHGHCTTYRAGEVAIYMMSYLLFSCMAKVKDYP